MIGTATQEVARGGDADPGVPGGEKHRFEDGGGFDAGDGGGGGD